MLLLMLMCPYHQQAFGSWGLQIQTTECHVSKHVTLNDVGGELRPLRAHDAAWPDGHTRTKLAACNRLVFLQKQRWVPPPQAPLQDLGAT